MQLQLYLHTYIQIYIAVNYFALLSKRLLKNFSIILMLIFVLVFVALTIFKRNVLRYIHTYI